jgi:PIN domain nuclease of toxin-antitoxin system
VILLDTHTWVWWIGQPSQLSRPAQRSIDAARESGALHISAISCWEVTLLVQRGRLELAVAVDDWIASCAALPFVHFLPVDRRIATLANRLPGTFHAEPADRLIVATALAHSLQVVTKDQRLRRYQHLRTIW